MLRVLAILGVLLPSVASAQVWTSSVGPQVQASFSPGKGLLLKSSDGDFALRIGVRAQMLYTAQHTGDWLQSFQVRRARLKFKGNLFGPHQTFAMELAISPRDIALTDTGALRSPMLDWSFGFTHLRDLSFRVGQHKVNYSRERVISSGALQFVDRAIGNGEFTLDRDIGLNLYSKDFLGLGLLRYYAGLYIGEGHSTFALSDHGLMYLARIEVLPLGLFDDYTQADTGDTKDFKLSIGLGYGFVDEAKGNRGILGAPPSDGGTTDYHNVTADLLIKYAGVFFQGEFYARQGERNPGDAGPFEEARNGWGGTAQLGYRLPDTGLEFAGRFSAVQPWNDSSLQATRSTGGAISYYFYAHAYKLQADFNHRWQPGGDSRQMLRVQLQLML